jgi:hypothetical protein
MGSPHPPLDSLLTFSQTCLEGFEQSCLNRISNLRKEFREIFEERVQYEVGARVARWILDGRQTSDAALVPDRTVTSALLRAELALPSLARGIFDAHQTSDANPSPDRTAAPALAQLELAFSNPARAAAPLASPWGDSSASEFPPGSMLELPASVALELQSPFRPITVSLDASAALRSLEYFARCKSPSLGGSQYGPPDFAMSTSSPRRQFLSLPRWSPPERFARCRPRPFGDDQSGSPNFAVSALPPRRRFLTSRHCSPLQISRSISSRIGGVRSIRHQPVPRIVHHALPLARREHRAALDSVA